jgi:hypothetical protein
LVMGQKDQAVRLSDHAIYLPNRRQQFWAGNISSQISLLRAVRRHRARPHCVPESVVHAY